MDAPSQNGHKDRVPKLTFRDAWVLSFLARARPEVRAEHYKKFHQDLSEFGNEIAHELVGKGKSSSCDAREAAAWLEKKVKEEEQLAK